MEGNGDTSLLDGASRFPDGGGSHREIAHEVGQFVPQ